MKKILFITVLLITITAVSQSTNFCGTNMADFSSLTTATFGAEGQNRTLESFLDDIPLVLKVHFWDINLDDGTNPHPITLDKALEAVAELNKDYNAFNIYFKYDAISPINSTQYYNFDVAGSDGSTIDDFIRDNNYYLQGGVNIYSVDIIVGDIIAFTGVDGNFGDFFFIVSEHGVIGPEEEHLKFVMTHEVAHQFNVFHPFDCGSFGTQCENVIRDPNHADYNADVAGDFIIDTNATPYAMSYDPYLCAYIQVEGVVDPTGLPYNYNGLEPEVINFMSYSWNCQQGFTVGQAARMRWYIQVIDAEPSIDAIEIQPVSILFEPFEGKYRYCDSNYEIHDPRFQPGFNYQFIECREQVYGTLDCPSDYGDYPFDYGEDVYDFDTTVSYNTSYRDPIIHPNHTAIRIFQLNTGAQLLEQPEKCYDSWKKSTSGIVKTFLDGVINTNYTIQYLDSIQSNNPTLIQDLNNGLYNIEKNFNDGTNEQNTILKIDD